MKRFNLSILSLFSKKDHRSNLRWGVETPVSYAVVLPQKHSSTFGRGGTGVCLGRKPKGQCSLLHMKRAFQLPDHLELAR